MSKVFLALIALFLLLPVSSVAGQEDPSFRKGENVTVSPNETINRDIFVFGDRVEISGTVNGDVYAAAGQVIVDGIVNGDLLTAGGTVNISGSVSQDVRVAGGQVTLSGDIGRNLTVGGGNVEITDDARIGGSLLGGGGNFNIAGPIGGHARIGSGNITLSGTISGDLYSGVGSLRLTPKAVVTGDLVYWSDADASISDQAVVQGATTRHKVDRAPAQPEKILGVFAGINLVLSLFSFISTLIVGLLLLKVFPRLSLGVVETLRTKPWLSLAVGFLALILTPIIFVLLLLTVIGIPLSLILLAAYFIFLYISRIFVMTLVGGVIFKNFNRETNIYWHFVAGMVIYYLLQLIPVLGGITTFLTLIFGFGGLLVALAGHYKRARKSDLY